MEGSQGNKRKRESEACSRDYETGTLNLNTEKSSIPEKKKQNIVGSANEVESSSPSGNSIGITFNEENWDWIESFTEAETGSITLVGPYLRKSQGEKESPGSVDLVGEVEARAIFDVVKALSSRGYICPSMIVPQDFDPTADKDLFNDRDLERLNQLPRGISYIMLKEPEKEIIITDSGGNKCGQIVSYGVPPNFTWLKIRCSAKSDIADNILPLLQGGTDNFAFAKFEHTKVEITNEEYMTTSNSSECVGDENLKMYVETGDVKIALLSMFTVRRGDDIVAKALMSYNNATMCTGGPNIVQIEVAKEWQHRGIMSWLVNSMEDYYVHKFTPVLGEYTGALTMTTGIIKSESRRDLKGNCGEGDWFYDHGFTGEGAERSKSLKEKVRTRGSMLTQREFISHRLKASLNSALVRVVPGDTLTSTPP